jgi:CheY-like chemotaxis protein
MQPAALTEKVLVVDDEPEERILLSRLLGVGGCEPIPASTAGEGFHKAPEEGPDTIVPAVMFDQKGHLPFFHDLELNADLTHTPPAFCVPSTRKPCLSSGPFPVSPGAAACRGPRAFRPSFRKRMISRGSCAP